MFDLIRSNQRILQFILLVLILPAFVFFGVSGYTRNTSSADEVASVGDISVTRQEYDRAVSGQLQQMRQMFGGQIDPATLDTPELRKNVLDGLTTQKVLQADAQKQNLMGSVEQVEKVIRGYQGLTKPDGSVDVQRLKELLAAQGQSLEGFRSQMQRDLGAQLKPEAVSGTSFLPTTVVERLIALSEEVRDVRELKFSAKEFEGKVVPNAEQIKAYYEKNQAQFQVPESAKVEYVVFGIDQLIKGISLNAEEVKTYYDQNKDTKYKLKEERQASHILLKTEGGKDAAKTKAQGLLEQVKKDPSKFAELAKANSQDSGSAAQGGDLGFFERESMVKPFADAAFALKEGQISELVESEFGFHIIRLAAVKGGGVRKFEEVKDELELELKKEQAAKKFTESAQSFTDLVYEQSDSFKPSVDKFKVTVQTLDGLARTGLPKAQPGAPVNPAAAVFSNAKLLNALFSEDSVKRKRNTDAIEIAPNTLASARIVEHIAAKVKSMDVVTADVAAAVKAEQAKELVKTAGEARLKALKEKASDEGFSPVQEVSRVVQAKLSGPAIEAIFRASRDKLPTVVGVEIPGEGYAVYQITAVKQPTGEEVVKRSLQAREQLARGATGFETGSYVNAVKARIPVTLKAIEPVAKKN
jgi:peptidyl-prolyl cis-trans isomerase D